MIHSVHPPKPASSAFTDLTDALALAIKRQFELVGLRLADDRYQYRFEAAVFACIDLIEITDSLAVMPTTSTAAECRKVMAQQISQVLKWDVCDKVTMVSVFDEASRAANALEKGTLESAELMRALVLLDASIELRKLVLGGDKPVI